MKKLIMFEFRNMWNQLTIVSVVALVILTTAFNFVTFINSPLAMASSGKAVKGIGSYRIVKNELGSRKGVMDQAYLDRLTKEYNESPEKAELKNIIGHCLTKYTFSNYIVNFAEHGIYFTNVTMDLDEKIYENELYANYKTAMLKRIELANRNNWFSYTDDHMSKLSARLEELKTPFSVDYYSGIDLFKWLFGQQLWFVLIVIAFTMPPLFSKDSRNGISELTLSSKFGRRKNMNAKLIVGNTFGVGVYVISLLTTVIEIGAVASFQGVNQSIQNLWHTCIFNMSAGEGMLIMVFSGLLTVLIITNLIILISLIIKRFKLSTLVSVLLMLLLNSNLFSNNSLLGQLSPISLATSFTGRMPNAFEAFYFVGDAVISYVLFFPVLGIIYLALIRIATLRQYKKYKLN